MEMDFHWQSRCWTGVPLQWAGFNGGESRSPVGSSETGLGEKLAESRSWLGGVLEPEEGTAAGFGERTGRTEGCVMQMWSAGKRAEGLEGQARGFVVSYRLRREEPGLWILPKEPVGRIRQVAGRRRPSPVMLLTQSVLFVTDW